MSIIKKVREKQNAMKQANDPTQEVSKTNQSLAIAALFGGIHSRAWETYMNQFAETTEELMRLKGTDGTLNDAAMNRRRAYLVANAICGSTTVGRFDNFVDTIDEGLDANFQPSGANAACEPG